MQFRADWVFVVLLIAGVDAFAQPVGPESKGPTGSGVQSQSVPAPVVQPPDKASLMGPNPAAEAPNASTALNKEWAEIASRLTAMDTKVSKLGEKREGQDYVTALIGVVSSLLGVFIGGYITFQNQKKLAEQQWQLKQLAELYGPLQALLRQSHTVYRHMNTVLEKTDPAKFRLRADKPGADFDDKIFEINLSGQWTVFRTIVHIDEVYGRGYGVEEYFDEVIAIGGRVVNVIEQKAGLARPDQPQLPIVFGRYLAHYSVLRMLHAQKKAAFGTGGSPPSASQPRPHLSVMETAAFPIEIQGLVDAGFQLVSKELNA